MYCEEMDLRVCVGPVARAANDMRHAIMSRSDSPLTTYSTIYSEKKSEQREYKGRVLPNWPQYDNIH